MTKHDLGLPSGIKDATYQQNREKEIGELKAENELLQQESKQLTAEVLELLRGD